MTKVNKILCLITLLLGLVILPQIILAQDAPDTGVTLVNPLGTTDPRIIIANIIKAIISIIGSLALLMFVYGGFLWITSFGEPKRIERGKTIVVWAIAGLAMIASAYVIVMPLSKGWSQAVQPALPHEIVIYYPQEN